EQECTPGQTKKQDCNTCNCTPTGVWACTRKGCPPH
nr:Chain A, SERINE PROTEASE INHIBITOR I [synthetic construct]2F91_B Chain B, Serine protease inhibitor I/II [synthetic construct]